jgi:magnesium chelatase family protein
MALAIANSRGLDGLNAPPVIVEVHIASGLPSLTLVGLPDTEVKEARDRVRAAILNSGFEFPSKRITVNLAPADLPKESGRFDLPIALGILAASSQIPSKALANYEFAGELSLSGELRPIRGALAMALQIADNGKCFILPETSAREAALTGAGNILSATSLLDVCAHLCGQGALPPAAAVNLEKPPFFPDLSEVRGQAQAKRALEIAAAGQHSLLMVGPPGSGKSMLAARLPGLMPAHLIAPPQILRGRALAARPFQAGRIRPAPLPPAAPYGLCRRFGRRWQSAPPGEISRAHQGVLFLDELPEFDRKVLETLREPLETGRIHIARAAASSRIPG